MTKDELKLAILNLDAIPALIIGAIGGSLVGFILGALIL